MTYCINPHCPKPLDPVNANNLICRNCGSEILLQGRYRVLKQLGQGGFGNTFEVGECGKTKVLKVLTENNPKAIEDIPFRMLDYRVRVYRRFPNKEMHQIVIYLRKTSSELVSQNSFKLNNTYHQFEVIRLWNNLQTGL